MTLNAGNAYLLQDLMLESSQAENADIGAIMKEGAKLAFVLEHHAQAIYQVQSGRHTGCWTTKYYENGIRKAKVYQNKRDLIQFLYQYYQEGEGFNKTFETVYEEALTYKREIELRSYKTIQDYRTFFKRYMLPIRNIRISEFTEDMIREWLVREVLPAQPKEASFKRLLDYMSVAFRYAVKRRYLSSNPMESIDYRDYSKHCIHVCKREEDHYFTENEIEQIRAHMLQNTTNPRALLALINAEMGTRADEPVVLHWEDVGDGVIYIHRQQIRNDETRPQTFVEVDYTKDTRCKDGKPREFPITPRIREILDMAAQLPGESEYIFHDAAGRMISKDSYEQFLNRHCKMIGLGKTNNHKFRHGLNNMLIEMGYPADVRAGLLGHTVRTNENHYSHGRTDRTREIGADIARRQAQMDRQVTQSQSQSPTVTHPGANIIPFDRPVEGQKEIR